MLGWRKSGDVYINIWNNEISTQEPREENLPPGWFSVESQAEVLEDHLKALKLPEGWELVGEGRDAFFKNGDVEQDAFPGNYVNRFARLALEPDSYILDKGWTWDGTGYTKGKERRSDPPFTQGQKLSSYTEFEWSPEPMLEEGSPDDWVQRYKGGKRLWVNRRTGEKSKVHPLSDHTMLKLLEETETINIKYILGALRAREKKSAEEVKAESESSVFESIKTWFGYDLTQKQMNRQSRGDIVEGQKAKIKEQVNGRDEWEKIFDTYITDRYSTEWTIHWQDDVIWETRGLDASPQSITSHPYTPALLLLFLLDNQNILAEKLKNAVDQLNIMLKTYLGVEDTWNLVDIEAFEETEQKKPGYLSANPDHGAKLKKQGKYSLIVFFALLWRSLGSDENKNNLTLSDMYAYTLVFQQKEFAKIYAEELMNFTIHLLPTWSTMGFLYKEQGDMSNLSIRKWGGKTLCDFCPADKKKFTETGKSVFFEGLTAVGAAAAAAEIGKSALNMQLGDTAAKAVKLVVGGAAGYYVAKKLSTQEGVCLTHNWGRNGGSAGKDLFLRFVGSYETVEKELKTLEDEEQRRVARDGSSAEKDLLFFIRANTLRVSMWVRNQLDLRETRVSAKRKGAFKIKQEQNRLLQFLEKSVNWVGIDSKALHKILWVGKGLLALGWLFFDQLMRHPFMRRAILEGLKKYQQKACFKISTQLRTRRDGDNKIYIEELKEDGTWKSMTDRKVWQRCKKQREAARDRYKKDVYFAIGDLLSLLGDDHGKKFGQVFNLLALGKGGLRGYIKSFAGLMKDFAGKIPILEPFISKIIDTFFNSDAIMGIFLYALTDSMQESLSSIVQTARGLDEILDMGKSILSLVSSCFDDKRFFLNGAPLNMSTGLQFSRAWENALHNLPYRALEVCIMVRSMQTEKKNSEYKRFNEIYGVNLKERWKNLSDEEQCWDFFLLKSDEWVEVNASGNVSLNMDKVKTMWGDMFKEKSISDWMPSFLTAASVAVGALILGPPVLALAQSTLTAISTASVGSVVSGLGAATSGAIHASPIISAAMKRYSELTPEEKERLVASVYTLSQLDFKWSPEKFGQCLPLRTILQAGGGRRQTEYMVRFQGYVSKFLSQTETPAFNAGYTILESAEDGEKQALPATAKNLQKALFHRGLVIHPKSCVGTEIAKLKEIKLEKRNGKSYYGEQEITKEQELKLELREKEKQLEAKKKLLKVAKNESIQHQADSAQISGNLYAFHLGHTTVNLFENEERLRKDIKELEKSIAELTKLIEDLKQEAPAGGSQKEDAEGTEDNIFVERDASVPPSLRKLNMKEIINFLNTYKGGMYQRVAEITGVEIMELAKGEEEELFQAMEDEGEEKNEGQQEEQEKGGGE